MDNEEALTLLEATNVGLATIGTKLDQESVDRKTESARKSRRLVAVLVAFALVMFVQWRNNADRIDDIVAARTQGRASVCAAFSAFTNSLIVLNHPTTDAQRATVQHSIDSFKTDLEGRLGPLNCHLDLVPAPPVQGSAP